MALPAGNMVDPGNTYDNVLAGQVTALTLSVTFDLYDPNFGSNDINLQDLYVVSGDFAGWTVADVLAEANNVLGGCGSSYTPAQLNQVVSSINENYVDGNQDNGFLTCTAPIVVERGEVSAMMSNNVTIKAFPNPFAVNSTIEFTMSHDDNVALEVFSVTGQKVAQLFSGNVEANKVYSVSLDGSGLADGMYIYRLVTTDGSYTGNIVRVK
jgi:hypothetical protein